MRKRLGKEIRERETFERFLYLSPTSLNFASTSQPPSKCMADPHAVPLPPSRGSLDSNREFDHRSTNSVSHLPPLAEQSPPTPLNQPEGEEGSYPGEEEEENERIRILEEELERTREDRDAWESQYQALLAKLTTMRNTVGDKLKQDAVSN